MMFDDDIYTDAKGSEWCSCSPQKERTDPRAPHVCAECLGLVPLANHDRRFGNTYCRCELQELPQNPERKCSRCGEFVAISSTDDGADWGAWHESRKRNEPELVRDVLARSLRQLRTA